MNAQQFLEIFTLLILHSVIEELSEWLSLQQLQRCKGPMRRQFEPHLHWMNNKRALTTFANAFPSVR